MMEVRKIQNSVDLIREYIQSNNVQFDFEFDEINNTVRINGFIFVYQENWKFYMNNFTNGYQKQIFDFFQPVFFVKNILSNINPQYQYFNNLIDIEDSIIKDILIRICFSEDSFKVCFQNIINGGFGVIYGHNDYILKLSPCVRENCLMIPSTFIETLYTRNYKNDDICGSYGSCLISYDFAKKIFCKEDSLQPEDIYQMNECDNKYFILNLMKRYDGDMIDLLNRFSDEKVDYGKELMTFSKTSIRAIKNMHRFGFIHGDIKIENFLFSNSLRGNKYVLSDFGMISKEDSFKKSNGTIGYAPCSKFTGIYLHDYFSLAITIIFAFCDESYLEDTETNTQIKNYIDFIESVTSNEHFDKRVSSSFKDLNDIEIMNLKKLIYFCKIIIYIVFYNSIQNIDELRNTSNYFDDLNSYHELQSLFQEFFKDKQNYKYYKYISSLINENTLLDFIYTQCFNSHFDMLDFVGILQKPSLSDCIHSKIIFQPRNADLSDNKFTEYITRFYNYQINSPENISFYNILQLTNLDFHIY